MQLQPAKHILKCEKDQMIFDTLGRRSQFLAPRQPPSLFKYLSATLFISAIKDGLMLSGTSAVLIL